jgi:hypothetical protein
MVFNYRGNEYSLKETVLFFILKNKWCNNIQESSVKPWREREREREIMRVKRWKSHAIHVAPCFIHSSDIISYLKLYLIG